MADLLKLDDAIATLYVEALAAIARADQEIGTDEAARLAIVVARRSAVPVDAEDMFFARTTPEALAQALRGAGGDAYRTSAGSGARAVGLALIEDAVEVATVDGDLNAAEAHMILHYARALGVSAADVHAITHQLDEWLGELG